MNNGSIVRLKGLYSGLGYVSAFTSWRCWHTPYAEMEKYAPKEGVILDIGCGYGLFSNYLAMTSEKRKVMGVDLSDRKIKYADRGLDNVAFRSGNAMDFEWTDCRGIALIHVLHHFNSFDEQEGFLRECFERLEKGGVLLVLEIDKKPFWKFMFTKLVDNVAYPGDRFYFRGKDELVRVLKEAGFRDVRAVPVHKGVPLSHILYVAGK